MPLNRMLFSCRVLSLRHGIIYVSGGVASITLLLFRQALARIARQKQAAKNVTIIIDMIDEIDGVIVGGGDFGIGEKMIAALWDYRRRHEVETITTVIFRMAFSFGASFSQVGDLRLITEKGFLRFHQATLRFSEESFNRADLQKKCNILEEVDDKQMSFLTMHGGSADQIAGLFASNAKIDAKEALRLNLADRIIPEPRDLDELVRYLSDKP